MADRIEFEQGLISISFVLSAVSSGMILGFFSNNGFKSPNYDDKFPKKILQGVMALSVLSLLSAVSVLFIKQAHSHYLKASLYLCVVSVMNCVASGLILQKRKISTGFQVGVLILNVPILIAIFVFLVLLLKSM